MQRLASLNLLALLPLPARAESAYENVNPAACPECFAGTGTSPPALVGLEPSLGRARR